MSRVCSTLKKRLVRQARIMERKKFVSKEYMVALRRAVIIEKTLKVKRCKYDHSKIVRKRR